LRIRFGIAHRHAQLVFELIAPRVHTLGAVERYGRDALCLLVNDVRKIHRDSLGRVGRFN